jgi:hypothetical protein
LLKVELAIHRRQTIFHGAAILNHAPSVLDNSRQTTRTIIEYSRSAR